jgi:hypothetical protein
MGPCNFCGTDDSIVDSVFDGFDRNANCVPNGFDAGAAVGDDADAVHTEKEGASVLLITGFFLNGFESGTGKPSSCHAKGSFLNFVFEPGEDCGCDAFAGLQHNIPYESVTDNDFDWTLEKISPFDITDEVNRSGGEKFKTFFGKGVSFGVLRTDGKKTDAGFFVSEDFF